MFKVNNKDSRKKVNGVRRSGVFIVNFEHTLRLFLLFLFVDFEQVIVCWLLGISFVKNTLIRYEILSDIISINLFHIKSKFILTPEIPPLPSCYAIKI